MRQTHVAEHQVAVAGTVEGHAPSVVPPAFPALPVPFAASDVASTLEHGEVDNMPPPVEAARGVSVPVVPDLTEMSRLLGQILQHQAHMQQQIHDISVRLGDSSRQVAVGPRVHGASLRDALKPRRPGVLRPCACNIARTCRVLYTALIATPPVGFVIVKVWLRRVVWTVVVAVTVRIGVVQHMQIQGVCVLHLPKMHAGDRVVRTVFLRLA